MVMILCLEIHITHLKLKKSIKMKATINVILILAIIITAAELVILSIPFILIGVLYLINRKFVTKFWNEL